MKEQKEWVHFRNIEWDDPYYNKFNVDTRDFHVGYTQDTHKDFNTLKKYPKFFLTQEELLGHLNRYYGFHIKRKCYMFDLEDSHKSTNAFWALKYLRIFRTELGFIVCNKDEVAIPRSVLMRDPYDPLKRADKLAAIPELEETTIEPLKDEAILWSNSPNIKESRNQRRKRERKK